MATLDDLGVPNIKLSTALPSVSRAEQIRQYVPHIPVVVESATRRLELDDLRPQLSLLDFGSDTTWASEALTTDALEDLFTEALGRAQVADQTVEVQIPARPDGAPYRFDRIGVTGTGTERLVISGGGQLITDHADDATRHSVFTLSGLAYLGLAGVGITYDGAFSVGGSFGSLDLWGIENCDAVDLSHIWATGGNRSGIYLTGCGEVTALGLRGYGNRNSGLLASDCTEVTVVGGHYNANGLAGDTGTGYGIAFPVSFPGVETQRIIVIGAQANRNFRKGLDAHSGSEIIMLGNQCHGNLIGQIFALASNSAYILRRALIAHNIVSGVGRDAPIEGYGIYAGALGTAEADHVMIESNQVYNVPDYGIWGATGNLKSLTIRDNLIDGVEARSGAIVSVGIFATGDGDADLVDVSDNTVLGARVRTLITKGKTVRHVGNSYLTPEDAPEQDASPWAASTAYVLGDKVQGVVTKRGLVWECTTAGTSGGTEPTWPATLGATQADGTVVWTATDVSNYIGVQVGDGGGTVGAGMLLDEGNTYDGSYESKRRSITKAGTPRRQRNNHATDHHNAGTPVELDPDPITIYTGNVTLPAGSPGTPGEVVLEMATFGTQSEVRVVWASGRQLSASRYVEVLVGGVVAGTINSSTAARYAISRYSGSVGTVQLRLRNESVEIDVAATLQIIIAPGPSN